MEKKNKLPRFELVLGDNEIFDGVNAIAFVDMPAHEEDFMYFNKDIKTDYKFEKVGDKMMVTGPALVPNKEIYRAPDAQSPEGFYVHFTQETIERCQELFFKRNQNHGTNVNHTTEFVDGVDVVESWIIMDKDNDKANALGFDLPEGTWMVSYKVNDEMLWNQIKDGEVKGFSIEGYFINELVEMHRASLTDDQKLNEVTDILANDHLSELGKMTKINKLLN